MRLSKIKSAFTFLLLFTSSGGFACDIFDKTLPENKVKVKIFGKNDIKNIVFWRFLND